MFDFHMHSRISNDSQADPAAMLAAAEKVGLREICFTDHMDYDPLDPAHKLTFDTADYNRAYDSLHSSTVKIRRGMEFGMLPDNRATLREDLQRRSFDFVIGSVHFIDGLDPYFPPFWEGRTVEQAILASLSDTLTCVKAHEDFDVLGHLTYISKTRYNPRKAPVPMADYQDLVDEIFKTLVAKGKGIELNTSGVDACGAYLPAKEYLLRFKELGGSIVTVGSDAHTPDRVGQYCREAVGMVSDIFGYVCTYRERQPIFHKI